MLDIYFVWDLSAEKYFIRIIAIASLITYIVGRSLLLTPITLIILSKIKLK